ncbi:maltose excess protein 1-like, chloroplastic [Benincasa hispida]|uniref:maltose excess protein 1-like, chloroplastic n=1 Tax=Benincasa hispida TaxID=102211 RepID=UPI0019022CD2|nr:maltose excess protein 1-like, chloroplastic [Benincasa hispida]
MATRFRIAEGDRFLGQVTNLAHIANANKIVKEKLTPTQLAMFKRTVFRRFVDVDMVFNSSIIHHMLLREVKRTIFNVLPVQILKFWEDFITVGGFFILPQARAGKLPEKGVKVVGALLGWTTTLLFMWMLVSQMWTNYLNPENIKGLSALTMLFALIGNGLVLPRALFI